MKRITIDSLRHACSTAVFFITSLLAGISPLEAESKVLSAEFEELLKGCIENGISPRICVKNVAPINSKLFDGCALPFCSSVPDRRESLSAASAASILRRIIAEVEGEAAGWSVVMKRAASEVTTAGSNDANALENSGTKLSANRWQEAALDHPAKIGYDKIEDVCREMAVNGEASKAAKVCFRETESLMVLRYASEAILRTIQVGDWKRLEASVACTQLLRKRFDVYFDHARYQWPWELALNSSLGFSTKTPIVCEGFNDVPSRQLIALHPTLGLRYSSEGAQRTDVALLVEVIGLRQWKWSGGEAINTRGASLVVSYSSQSDARNVGWGVLFHLRDDVSVGVVRHGSDADNRVSLILSYDFGKLAASDPRQACEKYFNASLCRLAK